MDGVRAYWNGQKLLSRHGKEIDCPKWFTDGLPPGVGLDGELWMGRGSYDKLMSILNSLSQDWSSIQYYVFDCPSHLAPYKERMHHLKQLRLPAQVLQMME